MRAARPTLSLILVLLAGCVGPLPAAPPGSGGMPAMGGWATDCTLGSHERALDASWVQDCAVRASHTPGQKQEVWLAVNPTDPRNVVIGAKDLNPDLSSQCVWNGIFVTHDAGATWKDVAIGGSFAQRAPTDPWFGYACSTDPMFQFGPDGALHYGVELYNFLGRDAYGQFGGTPLAGDDPLLTPGWKILLATSHDGGDSFPDVITWAPDSTVLVDDYSRMTISPTTGTIVEAINLGAGGASACNVLTSRDGGKTADPPVEVAGDPAGGTIGWACSVVAASPQGVLVLGNPGAPTTWSQSSDDGKTWSKLISTFDIAPIQNPFPESKYRTGTNFEIAYDLTQGPNAGTLYCIYADNARGNADVYVRSSRDDAKTWSDAVLVNDDKGTNHQFIPNIAVAGDGSVHAFFMDKRWDPANKLIDITHAVSLDGGQTWANERVTNRSFDGDLGKHQRGFPFIGDYIGVAAVGSHVWVGYPDASDGQTTVIAAAHVHKG